MATISFSFTVSEEHLTRIIRGIAYQHNYQDEIEDPENPDEMIPNPESKAQFSKRMAKRWIIANVKAYEANQAADAARQDAITDVEAIEIE